MDDVNAPTAARSALVKSAFRELKSELPKSLGRVQGEIVSGAMLRLGDTAVFTIQSEVRGRVVVNDINALGNVAQLHPNEFAKAKRIEADDTILQNLIELIRVVRGTKGFSVEAAGSGPQMKALPALDWGMGDFDYENYTLRPLAGAN